MKSWQHKDKHVLDILKGLNKRATYNNLTWITSMTQASIRISNISTWTILIITKSKGSSHQHVPNRETPKSRFPFTPTKIGSYPSPVYEVRCKQIILELKQAGPLTGTFGNHGWIKLLISVFELHSFWVGTMSAARNSFLFFFIWILCFYSGSNLASWVHGLHTSWVGTRLVVNNKFMFCLVRKWIGAMFPSSDSPQAQDTPYEETGVSLVWPPFGFINNLSMKPTERDPPFAQRPINPENAFRGGSILSTVLRGGSKRNWKDTAPDVETTITKHFHLLNMCFMHIFPCWF